MPGHRRHLHLTASEWTTLYGGKKACPEKPKFKRLPLGHCCLTLRPTKIPCCDKEGNIFEWEAIINYIKKFKLNPVSGKPLVSKGLIKLTFFKNDEDELYCPISLITFTPFSHVVAIKTSGNVFSFETVEKFNIKPQHWTDLVSNISFQRSDIVTLQSSNNIDKFNINTFYHMNCKHISTVKEGVVLNNVSFETKEILKDLKEAYKPKVVEAITKPVADKINAAHYSTGVVGASFTSTLLSPETRHEFAILKEDVVRYERVKKPGYIRLNTNLGPLNLELYCHLTPKTCENFIKLCQNGYYNNTLFHRSIRHFMIQGGDPTGTGAGGESFWGESFHLEINKSLSHTGRGVVSMVSNGKKTSGSQFFITFRSCKHLDGKHTIIGHLVGGLETLSKMESIEVDNKDRPIEDIRIKTLDIFKDPFQEADEILAAEREELKKEEEINRATKKSQYKEHRKGIGKYIDMDRIQKQFNENAEVGATRLNKKPS